MQTPKVNFFVPIPDFIENEDIEGFFKEEVMPYPPLPVGTHVSLRGAHGDVSGTISRVSFEMKENEVDLEIDIGKTDQEWFFKYFRDPENGWREEG